jgi:hypothetical protein
VGAVVYSLTPGPKTLDSGPIEGKEMEEENGNVMVEVPEDTADVEDVKSGIRSKTEETVGELRFRGRRGLDGTSSNGM